MLSLDERTRRGANDHNEQLLRRVDQRGRLWLSNVSIRGLVGLRIALPTTAPPNLGNRVRGLRVTPRRRTMRGDSVRDTKGASARLTRWCGGLAIPSARSARPGFPMRHDPEQTACARAKSRW